MKVSFTILCWVLGVISLFSQPVLQSRYNMFRADDEIIKQQVEYKDPGRSGENVLWDFGNLTSVNDSYTLNYSLSWDSTMLAGTEHRTMYYYTLSGDSLLGWGYENPTTLMMNERPEVLLRFPVHYGDSTFCYYNGNGKYCDRLKISAMGTVSSKADAYGMMILPGGDTLRNVIRVHTLKRIADGTDLLYFGKGEESNAMATNDSIDYRLANDTVLLEVETYRWYTEGYRYPVFETVKSITDKHGEERTFFNTAFFYPPQDHYYMETDEDNLALQDSIKAKGKDEYNPLEETRYNIFPNPVSTTLNVEIFLPVEAKVKIQVRSVAYKKVYINENKGKQAPGTHSFPLNVSTLPAGYYLLNIWADNYQFDEVFLKQ